MRLDFGVYVVRTRTLAMKELVDAFAYSGRGRVWGVGVPLSSVPHCFLIWVTLPRHIASTSKQTFSTLLKPQGMNPDNKNYSATDGGGGGHCVRGRVDIG
jgi:hypothetical protein